MQTLHCFILHYSADRDSEWPSHIAGHIKDTRIHLSTLNKLRKRSSGRKFRTTGCQKQAADIPQRLHLFVIISRGSFCPYSTPAVTSRSHGCQFTTRIVHTNFLHLLHSKVTVNDVSRRRCSDPLASVRVRLTSTLSLLTLLAESIFKRGCRCSGCPSTR